MRESLLKGGIDLRITTHVSIIYYHELTPDEFYEIAQAGIKRPDIKLEYTENRTMRKFYQVVELVSKK